SCGGGGAWCFGIGGWGVATQTHQPQSSTRQSSIDAVARQSVGLVLLIGLPAGVVGYWLSEPLLVCLQARAETRAYGTPYLRVYFAGLLFTWGGLVGAALFRGAGDVWTPLKLALGVALIQVALDYLFIYGAGPLPAFEVQGAAM